MDSLFVWTSERKYRPLNQSLPSIDHKGSSSYMNDIPRFHTNIFHWLAAVRMNIQMSDLMTS